MNDLKSRQRGFHLIELALPTYILSVLIDVDLFIFHSRYAVPLAFLLVNTLTTIFLLDNTGPKSAVSRPRLCRILFGCLVVLSAPCVWAMDTLTAVLAGAAISFVVPFMIFGKQNA